MAIVRGKLIEEVRFSKFIHRLREAEWYSEMRKVVDRVQGIRIVLFARVEADDLSVVTRR